MARVIIRICGKNAAFCNLLWGLERGTKHPVTPCSSPTACTVHTVHAHLNMQENRRGLGPKENSHPRDVICLLLNKAMQSRPVSFPSNQMTDRWKYLSVNVVLISEVGCIFFLYFFFLLCCTQFHSSHTSCTSFYEEGPCSHFFRTGLSKATAWPHTELQMGHGVHQ